MSSEVFQNKSLILIIPSILITCIMSIISFLSASTFFTEKIRIILGLIVGCLGSIGTLIQSFQSTLNYNTKAEAFRSAAESYDKLITKIKFELYNHDEQDFINKLEQEVIEIAKTCKYFPPQSVKNMLQLDKQLHHALESHEDINSNDTSNINVTIEK